MQMSHYRTFAEKLREMGMNGDGPYGVDGETTINIPAQAFQGRTGHHGKTFCGMLNLETGVLRIDCAEAPEMWLEMDFKQSALWYQPGQQGASDAINHCDKLFQEIDKKRDKKRGRDDVED